MSHIEWGLLAIIIVLLLIFEELRRLNRDSRDRDDNYIPAPPSATPTQSELERSRKIALLAEATRRYNEEEKEHQVQVLLDAVRKAKKEGKPLPGDTEAITKRPPETSNTSSPIMTKKDQRQKSYSANAAHPTPQAPTQPKSTTSDTRKATPGELLHEELISAMDREHAKLGATFMRNVGSGQIVGIGSDMQEAANKIDEQLAKGFRPIGILIISMLDETSLRTLILTNKEVPEKDEPYVKEVIHNFARLLFPDLPDQKIAKA